MLKPENEDGGKPFYVQKKFIAFIVLTSLMAIGHFAGMAERIHYEAYAILVISVGLSDGIYEKAKNRTKSRIMAGNKHFSLNKDHISNPGDLKIFSLGGIVYKIMPPQSGDEGTLVTRGELVEKIGENNFVVHGDMHEVEFSELPIAAKKEISSNSSYSKPYYMTRVPKYEYLDMERVREKIESLMELEDTNEQLNRRISTLRRMNSMDFEDMEDFFDTVKRISGESKTDKLLNTFKRNKDRSNSGE
jgi:hypothetical protein